jgi:hypothetical protein
MFLIIFLAHVISQMLNEKDGLSADLADLYVEGTWKEPGTYYRLYPQRLLMLCLSLTNRIPEKYLPHSHPYNSYLFTTHV